MSTESFSIRRGTENDLPQVLALINELAVYEKAPHEVENTLERMQEDGFGPNAIFGFFVAQLPNGQIAGLALYYYRYSTWKGRSLYLEDLVVTQSQRGKGIGQKLFDAIMWQAQQDDCRLVTWQVLDWNEPAIAFYKKLGAELEDEWINCKLRHAQIQAYPTTPIP